MNKKLEDLNARELLTEWIEALRSKRYKQARGALAVNGANCCLGVLMHVCANNQLAFEYKRDEQYGEGFKSPREFYSATPPLYIQTFLNLRKISKVKKVSGEYIKIIDTLIYMNDDVKASFKEIAKYLEKEFQLNTTQ